jgi:hypothetical protein
MHLRDSMTAVQLRCNRSGNPRTERVIANYYATNIELLCNSTTMEKQLSGTIILLKYDY